MLPNFLIIGACKSGTTSAYEYLKAHPQVYLPRKRKEPTYFADPNAGGITDWNDYVRLFEDAQGYKAVGEASVAYLFDPTTPISIRTNLGADIKLIAFLRNPVDMAYSLWGHMVRAGGERLAFAQALEREHTRLVDPEFRNSCLGWIYNYAYTARAMYAEQLQRYFDIFPQENMNVFIFEEFFRPSLPQYPELCAFLGVAQNHRPKQIIHNRGGTVRSKLLRKVLNEKMAWKESVKRILPSKFRMDMVSLATKLNLKDQRLPELDPKVRLSLEKLFNSDVRRLEQLLGRTLTSLWF